MSSRIQALGARVAEIRQNLVDDEPPLEVPAVLDQLITSTQLELNAGPLKTRPIAECETLQKAVELCSALYKRMPSNYGERELRELKNRVLSLKCGGEIPHEFFADKAKSGSFRQFVEANFLQNKLVTLHQKLRWTEEQGPYIPVTPYNRHAQEQNAEDLTTRDIGWRDLLRDRQEITNEEGEVTGYRYLSGGKVIFETNAEGELTPDYSFNYNGVVPYGVKGKDFIPYDRRNPAEWNKQFVVEVWTGISENDGQAIKNFVGDHSCLVLRDGESGEIYSTGQFGVCADYQCVDYVTPLARKTSGIESPDRYTFLPQNSYNFEKHKMVVSKERFYDMLARIRRDKADPDMSFSPVKCNCTSWVVKVLDEVLGFQVDSKMHLSGFLIRQLLPRSWQQPLFDFWENTIGQLPEIVQKALNFLPFVYIPYLVGALIAKVMSLGNRDGVSELPLIDIFFRPWEVYLDHPLMLRRSLAKIPKDPDGLQRLPHHAPSMDWGDPKLVDTLFAND